VVAFCVCYRARATTRDYPYNLKCFLVFAITTGNIPLILTFSLREKELLFYVLRPFFRKQAQNAVPVAPKT
jgi:hypothetical protein